MGKLKLGELCVEAGVLDMDQLARALAEQRSWGGRLGDILIDLGFVDETSLLRILSEQLGMPVIEFQGKLLSPETIALLTAEDVEKYNCLPLFVRDEGVGDVLYVAMSEPSNLENLDNLQFKAGMKVKPVLASSRELREQRDRYYGGERIFTQGHAAMSALSHSDVRRLAPLPKVVPPVTAPELAEIEMDTSSPEATPAEPGANPEMEMQQAPRPEKPKPTQGRKKIGPELMAPALASLLIKKGVISLEELLAEIEIRAAQAKRETH